MRLPYSLFFYFLLHQELFATRTLVFDNYEPEPSSSIEGLGRLSSSSDSLSIKPSDIEVSKIINRLNEKPGSIEHFQDYTSHIKDVADLDHMFQAGVYLMKSPISYQDDGVETIHAGSYFIDSRCLDLLNFVYLTKPNISPWLSYYYSMALLYFSIRAETLYDILNPIESAFLIYDQWLGYLSNEHFFEQEQLAEGISIPMTTFAIHGEIEKYDNAHLEFYSLLSLKTSRALMKLEKDPKSKDHKIFMKALIKYNPLIQVDEKGRKKDGQASWLDGPTYVALGAAAIPVILLARRIMPFTIHN